VDGVDSYSFGVALHRVHSLRGGVRCTMVVAPLGEMASTCDAE